MSLIFKIPALGIAEVGYQLFAQRALLGNWLMIIFSISQAIHAADSSTSKGTYCTGATSSISNADKMLIIRELINAVYITEERSREFALNILYNSKTLIPEDGVVHVIGSGGSFYEWVIPLLMAPQASKIYVSDPFYFTGNSLHFNDDTFRTIYKNIAKNHSNFLGYPRKIELTEDAFVNLLKEKIVFLKNSREAPLNSADFVFSRFPIDNNRDSFSTNPQRLVDRITRAAKPDGVAWVQADDRLSAFDFNVHGAHVSQLPPGERWSNFYPIDQGIGDIVNPGSVDFSKGLSLSMGHISSSFFIFPHESRNLQIPKSELED